MNHAVIGIVKEIVVSIFFCGLMSLMQSQNLVTNGSFETKSYCPGNFNQQQLNTIAGWWQATDGTPDYFNACSQKVGVPKNVFGDEKAYEGEAYAGLVTYSTGNTRNYREYLQTKLNRPLTAGEMVCIEIRVSAADFCYYVTDGIGVVVTKEKLSSSAQTTLVVPQTMGNPKFHMLDEASGWVLISDIYNATGGEQFVTIGNFRQDRELKIIKRTEDMGAKGNGTWAYVYIDNVVVKPVLKKEECSCENDYLSSVAVDPPLELSEYNKIKLDAVLFDFDQDTLTDTAKVELNEIYSLLRKNRSMYMEISGFTDIVGPDGYNLDLSKRRAQRVIDFLKEKGIAEDRLKLTFYGKDKPVADNESEEGRHQNRRVEFEILEHKFELVQ